MRIFILLAFVLCCNILPSNAQWKNRYPKVDGYGHHVYLEGHELPVLNSGPMDGAPAPLTEQVVFSAKGWLWLMDLSSSEATRITSSPGIDSRPNWSPKGDQIVFIRDNGKDTQLVLLNLNSKQESILVDTEAMELDPIFSGDGNSVYYSSGKNGSLDLWEINLSTRVTKAITKEGSLERLPVPTNENNQIVYLKKRGFSYDSIELLDLEKGTSTPLAEENFASQMAFSLSPDDKTLAYVWPNGDDYELRLLSITMPAARMLLTKSEGLPLAPKFSSDGQWVYFSEYSKNERAELKRIHINGGKVQNLEVKNWNWGATTAKLKITSKVDGKNAPVRMSITDAAGHPIIPASGVVHSEGQNGIVFFYSLGEIEVEAPAGELTITAVQGFLTAKQTQKVLVKEGMTSTEINLSKIWDAKANGWFSGDNHFHLNYGGTSQLDPEDIILDLKAENVDVAFPLVANLGNRFLEQDLWGWKKMGDPIIEFGQEVRSHFLGHIALIGTQDLHWPWVWGPRYDIYEADDRLNAEAIRFAREQNALGGYVHPVTIQDPFQEGGASSMPISLVADAVLGEVDLLEIVCLWSDEIGTAVVWHELLNIGVPIGMSAGSDAMSDLYRTMSIGATRVYVKPKGALTTASYLEALKAGRSFATNGPQLVFSVDGKEVGEVISSKSKKVNWTLSTYSPIAFETVELFVNGKVVWSQKAENSMGTKTYSGSIAIPEGGWVTARVSGGNSEWPMMDSYPFAETSPLWFGQVGSTSKIAKIEAAKKLLIALNVSEQRLRAGYGDNPIPKLLEQFSKARIKLEYMINNSQK
jgi:TolB protein